ncbi:KRSC protein, partial [Bucorvus abyssinicus]|nr:KRSC protein [Bucorvus abyssinicus]
MSCSDLCSPAIGGLNRSQPVADSRNEPCIRQCPDSEVVIRPPPVAVILPGPILSSFPQNSVVTSSGAPILGGSLGGFGGSLGSFGGSGSSLVYRGLGGYGSLG